MKIVLIVDYQKNNILKMINGIRQKSFPRNINFLKYPLFFIFFLLLLHSCRKDPVLPSVITQPPVDITRTSVLAGGKITSDGGLPILEKGICWDTMQNPDLTKQFITADENDEDFSVKITGLTPNTLYFIRAYATNELGTSFAKEISFTTDPVSTGTVMTIQPSSISLNTSVSGGAITDDGDAEIIQKGVCWGTAPEPEIKTGQYTEDGTGMEEYVSTLTNLTPGTRYYIRAYIKNSAGIAYGSEYSFNTKMADIQNNLYNTVTIGSQVWMAENLRTTRYNNNALIPNVTEDLAWTTLSTPAYSWFGNNINNAKWGALYNWHTVSRGNLCPAGWHVPSDNEFKALETYLEMAVDQIDSWYWRGTDQGSRLKNITGWKDEENGTNTSGFSALPYGYRYAATGAFNDLNSVTYWWSSDEYNNDFAWYRRLDGKESGIYRYYTSKKGGKYVRCIKNE